MNEQLKEEIIKMAIDIIHTHTLNGEPLNKNEMSIVAMAAKMREKKELDIQSILKNLPNISKIAPLLMSFITKGGIN